MLKFIILILALILNLNAFAGCAADYQKKITELSGKMNPPRTTVIANIGAEVIVVGTLASAGVLTVAGAIALPAAAIGAGSYLTYLSIQKSQYMDAYLTLKQAEHMNGPHWSKFFAKIKKKNKLTSEQEVRDALLRLDSEMAFCQENPYKGTITLLKPRKVRELVIAELN
jgi:hypothetical protein